MPLDLLLRDAGEYERTHQVMLFRLFSEGHLAEELGLPKTVKVEQETQANLFDLELEHGGRGSTGIELKTWSHVTEGPS
jgi:hypothetical protein